MQMISCCPIKAHTTDGVDKDALKALRKWSYQPRLKPGVTYMSGTMQQVRDVEKSLHCINYSAISTTHGNILCNRKK